MTVSPPRRLLENGPVRRLALHVRGVVQGVGFRPFVYRAAHETGMVGWVRNDVDGVLLEVQGPAGRLERFLDLLHYRHPPHAVIERVETVEMDPLEDDAFTIRQSAGTSSAIPVVPADLAPCAACLQEIRDPTARRYGYPFTNCTDCGPRFSIIRGMPYDRPRTAMRDFPMCDQCRAEYENPRDRRFHAQPIACPVCGPQLDLDGQTGHAALASAAAALQAGDIVALKGLGGFQLLVDATSDAAVQRLRRRKHREAKPLAVMFPTLEALREACEVSADAAALLQSPQSPIVLLRRLASGVAASVAPGNPLVGAMLPSTPLHVLLLAAAGRPLVCTSGNLTDEPMCIEIDEARTRLGQVADRFLTHNRPVARPVDDSVVRVTAAGPQVWRRARGYAPLPLEMPGTRTVLALGGHLKNTVTLAVEGRAMLGQHLGDLDTEASRRLQVRMVEDLLEMYARRPDAVACDLHPDYASTRYAERLSGGWAVPLVRVQHHHAHVAACMAEHRLEGPVLGLAWDGTGYGTDGTVWGGEALRCDGAGFERVARLRPFPMPGGERAVREPRRSALGILWCMGLAERARSLFETAEFPLLLQALERSVNCPVTSGMGRLFDAVAALTGLALHNRFEGQAAMALEFAAGDETDPAAYPMPLVAGTPGVLDWEPTLRAVLDDVASHVAASRISAQFHRALANGAAAVAQQAGLARVVLSGGCFQNARLARQVHDSLQRAGFQVYAHACVPPNDGGLSLGQAWVARRTMEA